MTQRCITRNSSRDDNTRTWRDVYCLISWLKLIHRQPLNWK